MAGTDKARDEIIGPKEWLDTAFTSRCFHYVENYGKAFIADQDKLAKQLIKALEQQALAVEMLMSSGRERDTIKAIPKIIAASCTIECSVFTIIGRILGDNGYIHDRVIDEALIMWSVAAQQVKDIPLTISKLQMEVLLTEYSEKFFKAQRACNFEEEEGEKNGPLSAQ